MPGQAGSPAPWSYLLIRLLFKFVLKIFYGSIVVENTEFIPPRGTPCIVCANHSNSLTDALLMVTSIPFHKRNLLRLTAKATQFGHKTFTSWLIESAGTVPIRRPRDYGDGKVDNSEVMLHLMEALEHGDAVCLFPEGASRFHPTIAPLKTGVARLVSDTLSRNRDNPDFEVVVLTTSVTYMHRQHFRSDVLVTFQQPLRFTVKDNPELLTPVDFQEIRAVTAKMHQQICSGTLDAPSWRLIRIAKLAARMYAPLGTEMSLGDYVRVVRTFLEAFKLAEAPRAEASTSDGEVALNEQAVQEDVKIAKLGQELKDYQDQLSHLGIKDDRVRRPLPRPVILYRLAVRLAWASALFAISLPGLVLWLPVFVTTVIAVHQFKRTGPVWDTYDEIAQYKLTYGLISGLCTWALAVALTLPFAMFTAPAVPVLMWMTLRWTEDAVSAFRAAAALARLLRVGKPALQRMRAARDDLHARVLALAVGTLGLSDEPERFFAESGGREKGRVKGGWESKARYFSVRRRRKRDWNETLRLYDQVDYPED